MEGRRSAGRCKIDWNTPDVSPVFKSSAERRRAAAAAAAAEKEEEE